MYTRPANKFLSARCVCMYIVIICIYISVERADFRRWMHECIVIHVMHVSQCTLPFFNFSLRSSWTKAKSSVIKISSSWNFLSVLQAFINFWIRASFAKLRVALLALEKNFVYARKYFWRVDGILQKWNAASARNENIFLFYLKNTWHHVFKFARVKAF